MKYCPYCGADVLSGSVSFCAECGKALSGDIKEAKPEKHKRQKEKKTDKTFAEEQQNTEVYEEASEAESEPDPDFGYDGYYDDVLPADDTVESQQLDKATVKNLVIIVVGVFLAITICVVAMYLM